MEKIRQIIDGLNEKERQALLLELLIPVLKNLDGERFVADDSDQVVGHLMSAQYRDGLIPAEIIPRFHNIDRSKCRPLSEIIKELTTRIEART